MSSTQVATEPMTHASAPTVDLKLEVIAIPISDIDRAKALLRRSGMEARRRFHGREGFSSGATDTSRIAILDPFLNLLSKGVPGSAQGMFLVVSDIEAARGELDRPRGRCERGLPLRPVAIISVPEA